MLERLSCLDMHKHSCIENGVFKPVSMMSIAHTRTLHVRHRNTREIWDVQR